LIKTVPRICHSCDSEILSQEFDLATPKGEDGIPLFFISKIIMECPNEHPNECEANGY